MGETWMLDRQVRELCEKDGGVKVYETVMLPAEKFNKYGQINFYHPIDGENALGSEFIFKENSFYYKRGNPALIRHHYQVLQGANGKLLGETVSYGRGGGGLPGPWHPSSFTCPEINLAGPNALLKAVFVFASVNKGD